MRNTNLGIEMGIGRSLSVLAIGIAALTTIPERACAQISERVSRTWNSVDGLCQNTARSIAQTPDGYLWIGTDAGLSRFDGVRFRNFGLADGLQSLWIRAIVNDGCEGLWIATAGGGLSHWDGTKIRTWTVKDGLRSDDLFSLQPAGPGSVWIGSSIGLQHFGPDGFSLLEDWVTMGDLSDHEDGIVRAIAGSESTGLWFTVTYRGFYCLHRGRLELVELPEEVSNNPTSLFIDRNGGLWAGMGNGIVLLRSDDVWIEFNTNHGVPFSYASCFAEGPSGEVWLGTAAEGVYAFRNGKFEHVPETASAIRSLQRAANGDMWVGTESDGLTRLRKQRVSVYSVGSGTKVGAVNGLAETADGQIWAATWGGSLHHGLLGKMQATDGPPEIGYYPSLRSCLTGTNGDLYVMGPQLLAILSADSNEWRVVSLKDDANLTSICELTDGTIVLGGRDGVLRRLSGGKIDVCEGAILESPILAICAGSDSQVWIATAGAGLFRWDSGKTERWTTNEGLPSNTLQTLHRDDDGTLWVGTAGAGLAWLDDGEIQSLDSSRGLHSDSISAIVEDESGQLWLGSIRGIGRYSKVRLRDAARGRITAIRPLVLDESDGMPTAECSRGFSPAGLRLRSGRLLFSTHRHIIAVDPGSIEENSIRPHVVIESAAFNSLQFQPQSWQDRGLSVGPGINDIRFEFTGLLTQKPAITQFRHRLVGLQTDWVNSGTRRVVEYSSAPPGEYRFEVAAASSALGDWTVPPAKLTFSVRPYYWQTGWFRLGIGFSLVCCGALGAGLVQRTRLLKARQQQRLAAAELEVRKRQDQLSHVARVSTLSELSPSFAHELKQPLAAILSNAQAAKRLLQLNGADDKELVEAINDIIADDRRAGKIIGRIRKFQKLEAFESASININEVVQESLRLVDPILKQRAVHVSLSLEKNLPAISGDQVQLEQVVVNLLVNAAQAMEKTEKRSRRLSVTTLTIDLNPAVDLPTIQVQIEDSGPGLPEPMIQNVFEPYWTTKDDGLGLGLSLCRSIILLHGGSIRAERSPTGGLLLCIELPAPPEMSC